MEATKQNPTEKISQRAYEIWESQGNPDGSDLDHWLQAEAEVSNAKPTKKSPRATARNAKSHTAK